MAFYGSRRFICAWKGLLGAFEGYNGLGSSFIKSEDFYLAELIYIYMKRKMAVVWVILIIMICSIFILVEVADMVEAPITFYVGGGGLGNFSTIQEAIDFADSGATVFVYNGIYYEHVIVNKTLNLIGENRNKTIIDGGDSENVTKIEASWVNITGFTFQESGGWRAGLDLNNVHFCKIFDNNFRNNSYSIALDSSNNNTIRNNNFSFHSRRGISLEYSNQNIIKGNTIASSLSAGILLYNSIGNIVKDNTILSGTNAGIHVVRSDNNVVIGNFAYDCFRGITIQYEGENNVTHNTVSQNSSTIL
jgi:parallel beta-helix repeat protein